MNITVKQVVTDISLVYDYFDQRFYCKHDNIELDEGEHYAYCHDCDNEDLTDEQANELIINELAGEADWLADLAQDNYNDYWGQ